jgi:hypothetical protein
MLGLRRQDDVAPSYTAAGGRNRRSLRRAAAAVVPPDLFVDKVVVTDVDLSLWRAIPALAGMLALVVGLLWEEGRA